MSSIQVEPYISLANDIMAIRHYTGAMQVLYYYDYLLTLPDEIKYAWKGRKTWIFWVFILNRYTPILYQIWVFFVVFFPQFSQQTCDKTAFILPVFFSWITLLAQVTLTARLYALTLGKKRVAAFFSAITFVQFIFGMYIAGTYVSTPGTCVYRSPRIGMAYISLSLFFDAMAFSVVVFAWYLANDLGRRHRLFLVIFGSHLVSLIAVVAARVGFNILPVIWADAHQLTLPSLQPLPCFGNLVCDPVFVSYLPPALTTFWKTLAAYDIEVDAIAQEGFESWGKWLDIQCTLKDTPQNDHANRIQGPPYWSGR